MHAEAFGLKWIYSGRVFPKQLASPAVLQQPSKPQGIGPGGKNLKMTKVQPLDERLDVLVALMPLSLFGDCICMKRLLNTRDESL